MLTEVPSRAMGRSSRPAARILAIFSGDSMVITPFAYPVSQKQPCGSTNWTTPARNHAQIFDGRAYVAVKENRRAQDAFSRVHARSALRWRLDEWAQDVLVTGAPSRPRWGADDTLVSH